MIPASISATVLTPICSKSRYKIQFADAAAKSFYWELGPSKSASALNLTQITRAQVGTTTLADLATAAITQVSSTTADLDAGLSPPTGGGVEVRWSDAGWGPYNDQN